MDERLKQRFDTLREQEAATFDDYSVFVSRTQAPTSLPSRRWRWFAALPVAAVTAALLVWTTWIAPSPERAATPFAPGQWAMPTDVLLEAADPDVLSTPLPFDGFGDRFHGYGDGARPWRNAG